jgi:hypothetical protein
VTLPDEADRLYDLPLEAFTKARNELAAELSRSGRKDEAEQVRHLRKPSAGAWAANQLARRHRRELDAFLKTAAQLRSAQLGTGDVRAATQAERDALARLLRLAGEYGSDAQLARVRETLQAAAVDDEAAELLRAGRLERELETAGFGALLTGPAPKRGKRPARRGPDPSAKRAVAEARGRVAELRRSAREAEAVERRAREDWERARDAAEEAARRLAEQERALAEAEKRLRGT